MCNSDHTSGLSKLALKRSPVPAQALKRSLVCSGCGRCCSVRDAGRSRRCREVGRAGAGAGAGAGSLAVCPGHEGSFLWFCLAGTHGLGCVVPCLELCLSYPRPGVAVKTHRACVLSVLAAAGRSVGGSVGAEVCAGGLWPAGPPRLCQVLAEAAFNGQTEHLVCSTAGRDLIMLN